MINLRELYQEVIIDHNRDPRNYRSIEKATHQAIGLNPVCGDKLTVYLLIDNDVIVDISFLGCGCAISQSSASLMTEVLMGKTTAEAYQLFERFHEMLTRKTDASFVSMDKLDVLAGVRLFPVRVKCATLAWHTLMAALKKDISTATTE